MAASSATEPYLTVLSLTRCERDLIAANDWEGVVSVGAERAKLVATLPPVVPAEARAVADEAFAMMQANLAQAVLVRDRTRATLARLSDGRRAMHAYAGTATSRRVDRRG
jgi:hypothetical protein